MLLTHRTGRLSLSLALLGVLPLAQADTHESLSAAVESLWSGEQVSISVLGSSFTQQVSKAGTEYRPEVKHAPFYLQAAGESAWVVAGRMRFNAVTTSWGNFPRLDMRKARLLEIDLPKKHYQVLTGPGAGLFGVGDWQRYGFLQVIDISVPSAPLHYPLYTDAGLGEHALGRLADSPVLNYARLVPTSQSRTGEIDTYEVSLYALGRKGPERVLRDGVALAYLLKREGDGWNIESVDRTPVTAERDEEHRPFTTPLRPALFSVKRNDQQ
ncbi:hypothetical protein UB43_08070 [Pseudomonas sp. 21]|uniref:hypothetical protein n=1 Tax=unclassified Pseudomonas TaxID=196821 RepID=UPI0005EB0ADC|nr:MULTISPECIES: hypothetical protein [unclassified Pseudomonas]KJK01991.1 hypothetical protein UB43_08070 [Pseudomonas sp. 21]MBV7582670.1 hypothetical protein [Pseudomonas sp. PDM33]